MRTLILTLLLASSASGASSKVQYHLSVTENTTNAEIDAWLAQVAKVRIDTVRYPLGHRLGGQTKTIIVTPTEVIEK